MLKLWLIPNCEKINKTPVNQSGLRIQWLEMLQETLVAHPSTWSACTIGSGPFAALGCAKSSCGKKFSTKSPPPWPFSFSAVPSPKIATLSHLLLPPTATIIWLLPQTGGKSAHKHLACHCMAHHHPITVIVVMAIIIHNCHWWYHCHHFPCHHPCHIHWCPCCFHRWHHLSRDFGGGVAISIIVVATIDDDVKIIVVGIAVFNVLLVFILGADPKSFLPPFEPIIVDDIVTAVISPVVTVVRGGKYVVFAELIVTFSGTVASSIVVVIVAEIAMDAFPSSCCQRWLPLLYYHPHHFLCRFVFLGSQLEELDQTKAQ